MSALGQFRAIMKRAAFHARIVSSEVEPLHVAIALAERDREKGPEAESILRYAAHLGYRVSEPEQKGLRRKQSLSLALRRAIEKEATAGRISIPSVLLQQMQLDDLLLLEQAVVGDGGNLRVWLERYDQL